jgi:hypothetical protein
MATLAHKHDAAPQDDPGEAEMPAAAFEVIQRARQLYGHPAAVELTAEHFSLDRNAIKRLPLDEQRDCLIVRATKILGAQIRALALSAKATENIQNSYKHAADVLDDFVDDEPDEPSVDWAQIAADAWNEGWRAAAVEYQVTRRNAYAWVRP